MNYLLSAMFFSSLSPLFRRERHTSNLSKVRSKAFCQGVYILLVCYRCPFPIGEEIGTIPEVS